MISKTIMNIKNNKNLIEVLFIFLLIFIRFVSYGFRYYYQLDDYIQYHRYILEEDTWAMIIELGLLGARPLAGLSDIFIWSHFFGFMITGVLIISAMHAVSAVLLKNLFAKYFDTGWFFIIVFALLPLGIEGTYWMSASTRIVTGLFWASVSVTFFQKYIETHKIKHIIIYAATQFTAFGYYEQILVFSFTLTFLIAVINIKPKRRDNDLGSSVKTALAACISIFNAAFYFVFTNAFLAGENLVRTEIVLPELGNPWYWDHFLPRLLSQIYSVFIAGNFRIATRGFMRGLHYIRHDNLWIFLIALIAVLVLLFVYLRERSNEQNPYPYPASKTKIISAAVFALLLIIAPVTMFFFIGNPWFSLRGACASFAGIALLGDLILRCICLNKKTVILSAAVFFAFVFSIAGVSEIRDYKLTYEYDNMIVGKISEVIGRDDLRHGQRVGILNLQKSYLDEQNFAHHEHIHGVTESTWALSGALVSFNSNLLLPSVTPMPSPKIPREIFVFYRNWNRDVMRIDSFDYIYYLDDNFDLSKLIIEAAGYEEHRHILYFDDGTAIAEIWESGGLGYIMMYK
jgi:hypothetical protein